MGYSHTFAPQGRPLTEEEAAVLAREVLEAARARLRSEQRAVAGRRESRRLPLALALRLHPEHFAIAAMLTMACTAAAWQVLAQFG